MNQTAKISNNTLWVIISLTASAGWIFMGLDMGFKFRAGFDDISYLLTLGGTRHTIMPILALICIPICAREYIGGFLLAIFLGVSTFSLVILHIIYMLIIRPPGFETILFGPAVWTVIQSPIIIFSFLTLKNRFR